MINKRGNFLGIMLVIGGLFLLIMMGIMFGIGSSVINLVMDTVVPEVAAIGVVGDVNVTHISDVTLTPVNTFIQSWTWLTGVLYVFVLLGIFGLAYSFRATGDNWLIGLFFGLVIILMIGAIFMSNIYEDVHNGTDELAVIVQEHTLLSFLVIYSPMIMAIISFICGILLFSGPIKEGGI